MLSIKARMSEYAKLLVDSPHWRWCAGMAYVPPVTSSSITEAKTLYLMSEEQTQYPSHMLVGVLPDLSHAPTVGALALMVFDRTGSWPKDNTVAEVVQAWLAAFI